MPRQPVESPSIVTVRCRRCPHTARLRTQGNELVGQQHRMRCKACGARGADMIRQPVRAPSS